MKIKAKFIGKDSIGYKQGQVYELEVDRKWIMRESSEGLCPYESIESFLNNWTDISHI